MLISNENKNMVVKLTGEIDHKLVKEYRERIDSHIIESRPTTLIFDFANINFMDSSGIGLVLGRYKKVSEYGGTVKIRNVSSKLNELFKLSGIYGIIERV